MNPRILSLINPWAFLVVAGYKKIETRCWRTNVRGRVLIHASNTIVKVLPDGMDAQLNALGLKRMPLVRGALIGSVEIVGIQPTTSWLSDKNKLVRDHPPLSDAEKAFGDYSLGRYGWILKDPEMLKDPIPIKGQLRMWAYKGELTQELKNIL